MIELFYFYGQVLIDFIFSSLFSQGVSENTSKSSRVKDVVLKQNGFYFLKEEPFGIVEKIWVKCSKTECSE